jgi:hypothetical protein
MLKAVDNTICKNCCHANELDDLAKILSDHEKSVEEFENIYFYLNRNHYLDDDIRPNNNEFNGILDSELSKSVSEFASFIVENSGDLTEVLEQKGRELSKSISELRTRFHRVSMGGIGDGGTGNVIYLLQKFVSLTGQFDYKNKRILKLVRQLRKARQRGALNLDDANTLLVELLEICDDENGIGEEATLWRAILSYVLGRYRDCDNIVNAVTTQDLSMTKLPFWFMKCLSGYRMGIFLHRSDLVDGALERAAQLKIKHDSSPLVHHLLSFLAASAVNHHVESNPSLSGMIEGWTLALARQPKPELKATIMNNMIFATYLCGGSDGKGDEYKLALQLANQLKDTLPRSHWVATYYHTVGSLYGKLSTLEGNESMAPTYREKARDFLTKAIKFAEEDGAPASELDRYGKQLAEFTTNSTLPSEHDSGGGIL